MIDLSNYRIIDISHELLPGERKLDRRYLHGERFHGRPIEVEEFESFNARMHFIHSQTHNGTHVEAPYKYDEDGADIAEMPPERYMGEAIVDDMDHRAGAAVTPDYLAAAGIKADDIVLL